MTTRKPKPIPGSEPQCGNCYYFKRLEKGAVNGRCRRYPPGVALVSNTETAENEPVALWTQTDETDACGEWRAGQ